MGYELFRERDDLSKKLSSVIELMAKYGREYAQAENDYKVELAKTALKLRDGGMAIGMIDKVIYGTKGVAERRLARDTAEVMYKTAQENIQSVKLQLRLIEAQIEREWSQSKREM